METDDGTAGLAPSAEVEALPLPQRAEAYRIAQEALQERLGLGGP